MSERRRIEIGLDVHRAIERARLSLDESENEILRRLLLRPAASEAGAGARRPAPGAARSRGRWCVEIGGRRIPGRRTSNMPIAPCCARSPRRIPTSSTPSPPSRGVAAATSRARRPAFTARSAHLAAPCRAALGGLVLRFEPVRRRGWRSSPGSRRGCAACITGPTCASSTISASSEARPSLT